MDSLGALGESQCFIYLFRWDGLVGHNKPPLATEASSAALLLVRLARTDKALTARKVHKRPIGNHHICLPSQPPPLTYQHTYTLTQYTALATEAPSAALLLERPARADEALITRGMRRRIAVQACYQLFWLLLVYYGAPRHLPEYAPLDQCLYFMSGTGLPAGGQASPSPPDEETGLAAGMATLGGLSIATFAQAGGGGLCCSRLATGSLAVRVAVCVGGTHLCVGACGDAAAGVLQPGAKPQTPANAPASSLSHNSKRRTPKTHLLLAPGAAGLPAA